MLHLVHVREVARERHLEREGDGLARRARELEHLAHRAGTHLAGPVKLHRRVGPGVVDCAEEGDDLDRAGSGRSGRDRFRLAPADADLGTRQKAHVGVVTALRTPRPDLSIGCGPRLGGCHRGDEQVVQHRLQVHHGLLGAGVGGRSPLTRGSPGLGP
ncbi:hypothetical protein GALL_367420 [mine drainage metagenome]|uniref:Uncharacterized protein n=1 Tax=mine drainage metagenome TaxID=410659 RepID=A0A1J5QNF9_9ZZZZ